MTAAGIYFERHVGNILTARRVRRGGAGGAAAPPPNQQHFGGRRPSSFEHYLALLVQSLTLLLAPLLSTPLLLTIVLLAPLLSTPLPIDILLLAPHSLVFAPLRQAAPPQLKILRTRLVTSKKH